MRDNPILPHSSLSDGIDKIKTAKTSNVCIFSWQFFSCSIFGWQFFSLGFALNWNNS